MNSRERFNAIVKFEPFDRLPLWEWATWWDKTIERWHSEGLPENLVNQYDIFDYFGLEQYKQNWIYSFAGSCPQPTAHGAPVISSMDEYEKLLPHLYPSPVIDKKLWEEWAKEQERGDAVLWFTVDGFFWFSRYLLGIEQHLYAFYDSPELLHRINKDQAEWILQVIDEICEICEPDFMTFAEDLSYNNGPMLSEEHFDEFMHPYYDLVVPHLKKHNIIPIVDSDGDISKPAYWFERAGIKGILPLERQAGVDIAELRKEHPEMLFVGHFDKMTMLHGEDAMRNEFERLLPVAAKGGFFISVDHQTPPGVSLENYRIYLRLYQEYAVKAGEMSQAYLISD